MWIDVYWCLTEDSLRHTLAMSKHQFCYIYIIPTDIYAVLIFERIYLYDSSQAGFGPPFTGRNDLLNEKVNALTNQATTSEFYNILFKQLYNILFKVQAKIFTLVEFMFNSVNNYKVFHIKR